MSNKKRKDKEGKQMFQKAARGQRNTGNTSNWKQNVSGKVLCMQVLCHKYM